MSSEEEDDEIYIAKAELNPENVVMPRNAKVTDL